MSLLRNGTRRKREVRQELMECPSYTGLCPHCGVQMRMPKGGTFRNGREIATLDHIRPLAANGSDHITNLRVICELCNQTRAITRHCVGAMACVRAVLERPRADTGDVAALWRQWQKARR